MTEISPGRFANVPYTQDEFQRLHATLATHMPSDCISERQGPSGLLPLSALLLALFPVPLGRSVRALVHPECTLWLSVAAECCARTLGLRRENLWDRKNG